MYNQRLDSMIHRPCMYQHTCSQKCDLERERERERESTQKLEKEAVASVAVDVVVGRA
jgi:predicted nucleic acid-binding Zn ribbon protein